MAHHDATIKDIAAILKVSVSTVSRALRDTHDVSERTKEAVRRVARDLNYKPNYNATALARGSTHNIGIILPFLTNYYFSTVISGVQQTAMASGFNIILFITNDSPETESQVVRNLFTSGVDGLLVCIASNSNSSEHFQRLMDRGTPVVLFDRVAEGLVTSRVMQDDFKGAFESVQHLAKNGYRKIAHIAGPATLMLTKRRLAGYHAALKKYNLPSRPEWIVHSGFSQQDGERDAKELLKCPIRPDAIFAANDRKAIGAMIALKKKGIAIGTAIGVVGFTDDPMAQIVSPALTTYAEPAFEIGKQACELLLKHIQKKNFAPEERILSGRLMIRESSKPNTKAKDV